jgi:hypothetical protein
MAVSITYLLISALDRKEVFPKNLLIVLIPKQLLRDSLLKTMPLASVNKKKQKHKFSYSRDGETMSNK